MTPAVTRPKIRYPDSDGEPMAENTRQYREIVKIHGGLQTQYAARPDVFVAADNLWYPVEGEPTIRQAPDVYVVFGRPKGDRGSYKQWEEGGIPLTVVFEVLSPGNRYGEMVKKFLFYQRYGVEEYYIYDPDRGELHGFLRENDELVEVKEMDGFVSPRTGVKFELVEGELVLTGPDGERFLTYEELAEQSKANARRAEEEERRAEEERLARLQAQQRADRAQERANQAEEQTEVERTARAEAEQRAEREAAAKRDAERRAEREAAAKLDAEQRAEREAAAKLDAERRAEREAAAKLDAEQRAEREAAAKRDAERQLEVMREKLRALGIVDPD